MAGKKKKSKKKKAKGSYIGAALIPPTIFAAVPRVPPIPRHAPELSPGLSTALLSTSILPQFIGAPSPTSGIRRRISDTDTSLNDFEETVDPGYSSTVDFRQGGYPGVSGQRISYTDRERAPTPTTDDDDTLDEDDFEDEPDPMYSSVRKPRVKKARSLRRFDSPDTGDELVGRVLSGEDSMSQRVMDVNVFPHEKTQVDPGYQRWMRKSLPIQDHTVKLPVDQSARLPVKIIPHQAERIPRHNQTEHPEYTNLECFVDQNQTYVEKQETSNGGLSCACDHLNVCGANQVRATITPQHTFFGETENVSQVVPLAYCNSECSIHGNSDNGFGKLDGNLEEDSEWYELLKYVDSYIQESQSEESLFKTESSDSQGDGSSNRHLSHVDSKTLHATALRNILMTYSRILNKNESNSDKDPEVCQDKTQEDQLPQSSMPGRFKYKAFLESDSNSDLVGNLRTSDSSESMQREDSDLTHVSDVEDDRVSATSPQAVPSGSIRRFEEEDLQAVRRSASPGVPRPGSSSSVRRSMSPAARKRSQSPGARSFHETVESVVLERSMLNSSAPRSPRSVLHASDTSSSTEELPVFEPVITSEQLPLQHATFEIQDVKRDVKLVSELQSPMDKEGSTVRQSAAKNRRPPIESRKREKPPSPKDDVKSTKKEKANTNRKPVKKRSPIQQKKSLKPHAPPVPPQGEIEDEIEDILRPQDEISPTYDTGSDLLHTQSPKLAALEQKNEDLLRQQQELQAQLEQQKQQQDDIMARLNAKGLLASQNLEETTKEEMGSLLHETQSVTEGTLQQQNDLIKSMENRGRVLEQEKEELQELNEQLQAEINSLRRLASIKDSDETSGTHTMVLKKQLQDFKEERETLKSAVQRLTGELSRYQGRFRAPTEDDLGLPMKGPMPSWLINTKYLAPLFIEYDDRLREKENVVRHYESELEGFGERVEEILKENQRLHLRLEQTDISGPVGMTEWRQLQEQCKLVLEENQLLMEQLQVQQNKARDMHRVHVQEVTKLSKKMVQSEAEKSEAQTEAEEIRRKLSEIKRKHEAILIENTTKVALEEHVTSVSELKRGREEEKMKLNEDLTNLKTKMQIVQAEKKGMAMEIEDLKAEIRQMEAELKAVQKSHRKSQQKIGLLRRALEETEVNQKSANNYLTNVVRVAEKMANERDSFAQRAHDTERQKRKALNKAVEENLTVNKLEEKLRVARLKASEKVQKAIDRLKQQDEDFNVLREEYEREIKHLRLLLREREDELNVFAGEKKQVEDDLETMWQTVTADNRRMRDTMRKSVAKLKEHARLNTIIDDEEDNKEFVT